MKKISRRNFLLASGVVTVGAALAACGGSSSSSTAASSAAPASSAAASAPASAEGKVLNIWCWNDEFQSRFNDYYPEVKEIAADKSTTTLKDGTTVKWTINANENNNYQNKLDEALLNQESAADDDKIDIFLIEADYALKYVDSDYVLDVKKDIGLTDSDLAGQYQYTKDIVSVDGSQRGTTWQATPGLFAYRRSIAKDVLGTDDPVEVQTYLSDWDKFNDVAAQAKAKGYMMTASESATYRVFSNNADEPWVDADNNLQIPEAMKTWMAQAKEFTDKGYTQTCDIWSDECTAQMFKDGKTMCYFGPAWYYNFSMGNAQDAEKGCYGDWAICEGPQAHFWGGTWLLAPAGTDNPTMVADIMNTFINDEEVCTNLVKNEMQFSNNQKVNAACAAEGGNDFLGGQNDTAMYVEMAKNIVFKNHTIYDQIINEDMQKCWREYCDGDVTEEQALANFYALVSESEGPGRRRSRSRRRAE